VALLSPACLSFDSEMQMITNHNKSRYFSVQLGIFSLKVFCGGWVVGGGLQVTLVFCFGPKHNNCSLDLNLDQAEQQAESITGANPDENK
jgi:hypothetical protein